MDLCFFLLISSWCVYFVYRNVIIFGNIFMLGILLFMFFLRVVHIEASLLLLLLSSHEQFITVMIVQPVFSLEKKIANN